MFFLTNTLSKVRLRGVRFLALPEQAPQFLLFNVIARSAATWQSLLYFLMTLQKIGEIATLPLVARNDKVTAVNAFVLVMEGSIQSEWMSWRQKREGEVLFLVSIAFMAALAEGMVV